MSFTPDKTQQAVIDAHTGYHIVLAPPGCGKTQVLTERIRKAHDTYAIPFSSMACLTFTNRAARGMTERIMQNISNDDVRDVFVGNIHRYCIRLLTSENIIPQNTAIIDDDDAISILSCYMNEDEMYVRNNYNRNHAYFEIIHLSHMMHQIEKNYPREIRLHPDCLSKEDVTALQAVSYIHGKTFSPEVMTDIYQHADEYLTSLTGRQVQLPAEVTRRISQNKITETLRKMEMAYRYEQYKKSHFLVDFNDILLITYDTLISATNSTEDDQKDFLKRVRKSWIQLDEVQDLSPLQIAIVDLITDKDAENITVMYLGDEQQSIFSFMGAKLSTLNMLRSRCGENIHYLGSNHRSPAYLLNLYNTFAEKVLNIPRDILPIATHGSSDIELQKRMITTMTCDILEEEYREVALQAKEWHNANSEETSAIIVLSNADAEAVSNELSRLNMPHFKVSGTDLFSTPEIKLLLAHFSAVQSDNNMIAWSRILLATHAIASAYGAREVVHNMLYAGISPAELVASPLNMAPASEHSTDTYTWQFAQCYEQKDIVIFDTETTGLDTFMDDIIQIAAMRVRNGAVIESFMVHIETEREIPAMLGDIVNPIVEERKTADILSHSEALHRFAAFAKDATLLAHNADFDIHILQQNIKRYTPDLYNDGEDMPDCYDSLRLIRLLEPSLKVHKLKYLLEVLHIEGSNSHLADDDVFATKGVVDYCYRKACEIRKAQERILTTESIREIRKKLRETYAPLYLHTKQIMWKACEESDFTKELTYIHDALVEDNIIGDVDKLQYVCDYLDYDLIDHATYPYLSSQLMKYATEITTLKEADLCNSQRINEKIYVTTVHKAKGLEFDNVIVFDAVDGRYPNFNSKLPEQKAEDARKLYVAMTRARKRLCFAMSKTFVSRYGSSYDRKPSPFLV